MKECRTCKKLMDLTAFHANPKASQGVMGECKECSSERSRKAYLSKKAENPLFKREIDLKRRYNLTLEDYNALELKQANKCKICRCTPTKKLVVDHCHITDEVRGLLCHHCNVALGYFKDKPALMPVAQAYLIHNGDI